MLEAGMNPELESGRGSITQRRNYFMISEDFCNLQAQFGFHFCTVETRVSEVPEENYLSFRFKGGAADMDRRHERVRFIADFLEDQDFQVEVRQDLLHARLENVPRDFVLQRLKVVGYMLIHTCQLDMVMHNQSLRLEHRKKMEEDIGALTGEV
jgi:pyruvate,water dikinase